MKTIHFYLKRLWNPQNALEIFDCDITYYSVYSFWKKFWVPGTGEIFNYAYPWSITRKTSVKQFIVIQNELEYFKSFMWFMFRKEELLNKNQIEIDIF